MKSAELRKLAEKAFGPSWQTKLARALPCADRTVRRWLSGERGIGPMIEARIKQVCKDAK